MVGTCIRYYYFFVGVLRHTISYSPQHWSSLTMVGYMFWYCGILCTPDYFLYALHCGNLGKRLAVLERVFVVFNLHPSYPGPCHHSASGLHVAKYTTASACWIGNGKSGKRGFKWKRHALSWRLSTAGVIPIICEMFCFPWTS